MGSLVWFVLVGVLVGRAHLKVGRLLWGLKEREYLLWSQLSITQTLLEPGRTLLLFDEPFWSRVKNKKLLRERKQALVAVVVGCGVVVIWIVCSFWFWRSGSVI